MAQKQSNSTDWVYLKKYYSFGSVKIYVKNLSAHRVKVEFREIINDNIELGAFECVNHSVSPYTEVWFKSIDGNEVSVMSEFGSCDGRMGFTEETVDDDMKKQILSYVEGAKSIQQRFCLEINSAIEDVNTK
jgi:hypothetical protein